MLQPLNMKHFKAILLVQTGLILAQFICMHPFAKSMYRRLICNLSCTSLKREFAYALYQSNLLHSMKRVTGIEGWEALNSFALQT